MQQPAGEGTDRGRYDRLGQGGWAQIIRAGKKHVVTRWREFPIINFDDFSVSGEGRLSASGFILRPKRPAHAHIQSQTARAEGVL